MRFATDATNAVVISLHNLLRPVGLLPHVVVVRCTLDLTAILHDVLAPTSNDIGGAAAQNVPEALHLSEYISTASPYSDYQKLMMSMSASPSVIQQVAAGLRLSLGMDGTQCVVDDSYVQSSLADGSLRLVSPDQLRSILRQVALATDRVSADRKYDLQSGDELVMYTNVGDGVATNVDRWEICITQQ